MTGTIFFDLHGVLVNSRLMLEGYERTLRKIYARYGFSPEESLNFHQQGLTLFKKQITVIGSTLLVGEPFLDRMAEADKEWDQLMQSFITNRISEEDLSGLESRTVEYQAGAEIDSFYQDAKEVLSELLSDGRFRVIIASNAHSAHISGVMAGGGFLPLLEKEQIVGWDTVAAMKHNPFYFKQLLSLAQGRPFFVGNSTEEILNANKVGMRTILLEREREVSLVAKEEAWLVVNSLYQLPEKLSEFD